MTIDVTSTAGNGFLTWILRASGGLRRKTDAGRSVPERRFGAGLMGRPGYPENHQQQLRNYESHSAKAALMMHHGF